MLAIDTHEYIKELTAAGFSSEQAEVQSRVMARALTDLEEESRKELATKAGLMKVEMKLQNHILEIKSEVRVLKWMMGFMLAGITALVLKTFF